MRRLSPGQCAMRSKLADELRVAQTALEAAAQEYSAKVVEAQAFAAGVAQDIRSHIEGKSDRWQEGDAGQAYEQWAMAWEELELPEYVELDDRAGDLIEQLDEEPS